MLPELQTRSEGRRYTLADQARALAVVLHDEFGVPFTFYDAAGGEPVAVPDGATVELGPGAVQRLAADGRCDVAVLEENRYRLSLSLYQAGRPVLVAAAVLPGLCGDPDARRPEQERLRKWLQSVSDRLRLTDQLFEQQRRGDGSQGAQAAIAWEALLTVDHVVRRMRIHKDTARTQQRLLEAAFHLLPARALAWVPPQADAPVVLLGEPLLAAADCRYLAGCLAKNADSRSPEPVFCNDLSSSTWGVRFPQVANLMAFPVVDQGPLGWVIALNKKSDVRSPKSEGGKRTVPGGRVPPPNSSPESSDCVPFRKSDAALLTPFVALLELLTRAARRYQDLKDLLVGLTRSLTAALDAKDSYTFGHSERVARIAVELGKELGLGADDLSDIYLAGLLHDVGKIGIKDAVLCKPGPLNREEYEHIKQHVTIGYSILADLHPIRNLLPGVLWHHERWDGKGYPDGLAGEAIPLLARILAVADAYDAMSTARPYREAMPCRRVEEILTEGAGSQWDARVIEAFARCRHKVHAIRQRGVGESLCAAIDGALRSGDTSHSSQAALLSVQDTR